MSYNSPNQHTPEITPCTFCCEMECFYPIALIFITDLQLLSLELTSV